MWTPSDRVVGAVTALGGLLAIVATVPTRWYGPRPTDSYVFDPPRFSALWVERTVVPVLAVAAALLILTGLLWVFRRDRARMARWQRWFAVVCVIGAAVGTLSTMLFASVGGRALADPTAALNALLGVGLALLALLLLFPGLLAWGAGYLRSGRQRLGAALVGGPVVAVAVVAASIALDFGADSVGALPVVVPVGVAVVVVGYDLWAREDAGV
ncbi:hypothetical protein [Haloplanus aerogenes]|uniref:Uncharacterized protein n=1 Tax=Haloplanus aerogenes TaxID=660522 RepID=A0A3M0D9G5_9EURY|nr:hypothetical protein [Haloplanus aerogenes]AZH26450.1 hypothetical protein DU502_14205 [Haloplanus aerogenes]RMB18084.1 hypothetical protein ATH50_1531 [Haloplanus aerogenes]